MTLDIHAAGAAFAGNGNPEAAQQREEWSFVC